MSSAAEILSPAPAGATSRELTRLAETVPGGVGAARARGRFTVRHGNSLPARLFALLYRLPPAGERIDTVLEVDREGDGTRWSRSFGGHWLVTRQRRLNSQGDEVRLAERFRGVECRFRLDQEGAATVFRQTGATLCLGPLRLPLAEGLAPRVEAREEPGGVPGATRISVAIHLPLGGLLVAYQGEAERVPPDSKEGGQA